MKMAYPIELIEVDKREYEALKAFKKLMLSGEVKFLYDQEGFPISYTRTRTDPIESIDAIFNEILK